MQMYDKDKKREEEKKNVEEKALTKKQIKIAGKKKEKRKGEKSIIYELLNFQGSIFVYSGKEKNLILFIYYSANKPNTN